MDNDKNKEINKEQCNKKKNWFKNVGFLTRPIYLLAILIFTIIFGLKSYAKTSINDLETGLHYIGEMSIPRALHTVLPIDEDNILIIGGISKTGEHYPYYGEGFRNDTPDVSENSIEIFNLKTKKSQIYALPEDYNYKEIESNNGNILILGNKHSLVFEKERRKIINIKNLFPENYNEFDNSRQIIKLGDKTIVCEGYVYTRLYGRCSLSDLSGSNFTEFTNNLKYNNQFTNTKLAKLNNKEFLIYRYQSGHYGVKSQLYIEKYSIKKNKVIQKFIQEVIPQKAGNIIDIFPINNNLILISEGRMPNQYYVQDFKLQLYDLSKKEFIKAYNVDKFITFMSLNKNELVSTDLEYILNIKDYTLKPTNIDIPVEYPEVMKLQDNRILVVGGYYKDYELNQRLKNLKEGKYPLGTIFHDNKLSTYTTTKEGINLLGTRQTSDKIYIYTIGD